jgi:hypothetical protein
MNRISKISAGAAAAAMTLSLAAPADAQYYDRSYRDYRHYDRGIGAGDIITGVAILGGIAAITSALSRDGSRYGYGYRDRYRDDYRNAVNSCGYQAERAGRGRVSIVDVDRRGSYSYRVRGVIEGGGGYGYDNRGYGRYDDRYSRYGTYDNRYGGYDNRYGTYDNRYGYGYGGYDNRYGGGYDTRYGAGRVGFTCTARGDGRVTGFRIDNNYRW